MGWYALVWPVLTVVLLFVFCRKQTARWEYATVFAVPILLIPLLGHTVESSLTTAKEYWGGWGTHAVYTEEWTREWTEVVIDYDSKGNVTGSHTVTHHDYQGPTWILCGSNDEVVYIGRDRFEELKQRWGTCVDRRNIHSDAAFGRNGGDHTTTWNGSDETIEPVISVHAYENRVQASNSVFKFPKVDPKRFNLYSYPRLVEGYRCPSILGDAGPQTEQADRLLTALNAKFGASKQIRVMILMFRAPKQPLQAGIEQEAFWKGGNKNELNIAIGVDDRLQPKWCHVFSWTPAKELPVETESHVMQQKVLDPVELVNWLAPEIQQKWQRKHFRDFNYLTVELPAWALVLTHVLTILACAGTAMWVYSNEFEC